MVEQLRRRINAAPQAYGLTARQADQYAQLHDTYATLYQLISQSTTRTPVKIVAKDEARRVLIRKARQLAGIARAHPSLTDEQRLILKLARRRPGRPLGGGGSGRKIEAAPGVRVVRRMGRRVEARLYDPASPTRVAKPRGVFGATLFTFVGDEPPTSLDDWTFYSHSSRTRVRLDFDPSLEPGTMVWIVGCWFGVGRRHGPISQPRRTWIVG